MNLGWEAPVRIRVDWRSLCPICRGTKLLCGKPKCPVMLEYELYVNAILPNLNREIDGNSPPSIFVGRYGYPKVWVGPMVPPIFGDTSIYGSPERWINSSLEEILLMTTKLVYGREKMHVTAPRKEPRMYMDILDIAISKCSPEVEMKLDKPPTKYIFFSEDITPFGPSARIDDLSIGTLKIDYRIDKAVSDYDLRAEDAVFHLYREGLSITSIQRAFSIGGFGVKRNRKIVPTRWSITAVDDIIGRRLIKKVKRHPPIDRYHVFSYDALENRYLILLLPGRWSYEFLEAWYPGTFWNRYASYPVIYSDYESYNGRTEYAEIGGCYYAARLATVEFLDRIGRQATAIIFREAYPGYLFPVGVWSVRESVRSAYKGIPERFKELDEALNYVFSRLKIRSDRWFNASYILTSMVKQEKLDKFLS